MLKKKKRKVEGIQRKVFFVEECQLVIIDGMTELEKSPFCWNPRVIIDLDKNDHWMPKTLHKICWVWW